MNKITVVKFFSIAAAHIQQLNFTVPITARL
jgi:hypothetical protein